MAKKVLLPDGKVIYQSDGGQAVSSDNKNFVDFILAQENNDSKTILELGTGCGILSIMLKHFRSNWNIIGIDIQKKLIDLAKKNDKMITFIEADITTFQWKNKVDIVFANPPYFPKNKGRISPDKERAISRHEIKVRMKQVFACIKLNLKNNGIAYLLYPEWRKQEIFQSAVLFGMQVVEQEIINYKSKEKKRIMVKIKNVEI